MGLSWDLLGFAVLAHETRDSHGTPMCLYCSHESPIGTYIGLSWNFHGTPNAGSWVSHGTSMGLMWVYSAPMGLVRNSHRSLMDC